MLNTRATAISRPFGIQVQWLYKNFAPALIIGLAILLAPASTAAQEADSEVTERLQIKLEKPRTVMVYPSADERLRTPSLTEAGRVYWYVPFTLENAGDKEADFFVTVNAASDSALDPRGVKYSDLALDYVEAKIEQIEGRHLYSKADILKEKDSIAGYTNFKAGSKRRCVAIFNPLDSHADRITLQFHGLFNAIEFKDLGDGKMEVKERVLTVIYKRPGDEFYTSFDTFTFVSKKWETITKVYNIPSGKE